MHAGLLETVAALSQLEGLFAQPVAEHGIPFPISARELWQRDVPAGFARRRRFRSKRCGDDPAARSMSRLGLRPFIKLCCSFSATPWPSPKDDTAVCSLSSEDRIPGG